MRKAVEYINIRILCLGLLFFATCALADRPVPPRDYTKITENSEHVFVMLRPDDSTVKTQSDLREKYKIPGLYRNDGSGERLWAVDWYEFGVTPSSDGKHLIRWGPWASTTDQLALSFYDHGSRHPSLVFGYFETMVQDTHRLFSVILRVSRFIWRVINWLLFERVTRFSL